MLVGEDICRVMEEMKIEDEKLTLIEARMTKRNARGVQDSLKYQRQVKVELGERERQLRVKEQSLMDKENDLHREILELQLSARQSTGQSAGGMDIDKVVVVVNQLQFPLKSIKESTAL